MLKADLTNAELFFYIWHIEIMSQNQTLIDYRRIDLKMKQKEHSRLAQMRSKN